MGGAVSSGRDHNELIDNLVGGNYIRTANVEAVFRSLDRADYMEPESRDQAYKDLAWRHGLLHMSAPCIYSEVMESLELKAGLSFLNIGSGTGYLSTMVGLIIGPSGINHGIEIHQSVVDYATKKLSQFIENSATPDEFEFCEPKFFCGNGLCLAPLQAPYDRVYCGAGCPEEFQNYLKQLIKIGGVLVMPLQDNLLQVRRTGAAQWESRGLLNVSFATLRTPQRSDTADPLKLDTLCPPPLQTLCRGVVRAAMRRGVLRRHPELRPPAPPKHPRHTPAKKPCPRRICIPLEDDSDIDLNALHDLDNMEPGSGANEMNALLSLVLNMGHNRVAGALRYEPSSSDSEGEGEVDGEPARPHAPRTANLAPHSLPPSPPPAHAQRPRLYRRSDNNTQDTPRTSGILMVDLRQTSPPPAHTTPPASDTALPPLRDPSSEAGPSRAHNDAAGEVASPDDDDRTVPAEVEIYLGRRAGPAGDVDLERMESDQEEHSSDDEWTDWGEQIKNQEKRMKLDSGIGEENCGSGSSASTRTDRSDSTSGTRPSEPSDPAERSDRSDRSDRGASNDDADDPQRRVRRRKHRRCKVSWWSTSSTSASGSAGMAAGDAGTAQGAEEAAAGEVPRRNPKRRAGEGGDARRVRLSVLMKQAVKELPLPHALKKYINLERCYQF